jgi:hypothetical protein
VLSTPLAKMPS